jgi:TorA maturation chaperone TorD
MDYIDRRSGCSLPLNENKKESSGKRLRQEGLEQAIYAAGGVSELARRLGIAQPSVSNWDRVPADRVLAVEAATGIPRVRLRPDLYGEPSVTEPDDVDSARAQEYALLARLLGAAPSQDLLDALGRLRGDASPLGLAHAALAEAADRIGEADAGREYFDLFVGVGRSELLPYGSYYLAGFLNERPLARLRADLARIGIERTDATCEPEDHAAILCEIMAGLASGQFGAGEDAQREIFQKHMAPWMGRLFADMENSAAAKKFYRHVGALGRVFLHIEEQAFALAGAPARKDRGGTGDEDKAD